MSVQSMASLSRSLSRKETFSPLERELIITVLEDTIDQLSVLDAIIPCVGKPSATADALSEALAEILENQQQLEEQFERLKLGDGVREEVHGLSTAAQATRNIKTMAENLEKLKRDQNFFKSIMTNTLHEMAETGTVLSLQSSIAEYENSKTEMEDTVKREQDCKKLIKQLKRQLLEVKREKEEKVTKLDEEIAHCKDQLQELKARTGLISKYVKKQSEVKVQCSLRQHTNAENELENEKMRLTQELQEEKRAHAEIENYLKKHIEDLDGKVDYWMSRYEDDLETKTLEVQDTKSAKAVGLQKLEELSRTYKQREEMVVEHRAMKERQKRKEEQDRKENAAATKIQAWWRGVMVRKGLGQFKKGGKKKGKKEKKGKKGKKGKKKK